MKSILIVDDNPIVVFGCRQIFDVAGARQILSADSVTSGYESCIAHEPDVAVIDLQLGRGESGLSLIRKIRELDSRITIVAFTMHDDQAIRREALKAGATAFVCKDAHMNDLLFACGLIGEAKAA
jgi:two-component system, NarL family, invasion response regulator UvrY